MQTTSKKRVTITTSSVPLDSTEFSSTTASFETTAEPFRNGSYADLKSKLDNVRDNEKVDPARQRITHWSLDYQEVSNVEALRLAVLATVTLLQPSLVILKLLPLLQQPVKTIAILIFSSSFNFITLLLNQPLLIRLRLNNLYGQ